MAQTAAQRALELRRRNRRLPTVNEYQSRDDRALSDTLGSVLEHLRLYEGDKNAPKERFVTLAELENAGLIKADVKGGFGYISQVLRKDVAQTAGSTTNPRQKDPVKKRTALEGRTPGGSTNAPNQGPISYRTGDAGGGGAGKLGGLLDVVVPKPAQNQFLAYSGARWTGYPLFNTENTWRKTQKFINGQIIEGGEFCIYDDDGVNAMCLIQDGSVSTIQTVNTSIFHTNANVVRLKRQDGTYGLQFLVQTTGVQVNTFGTGSYGQGNLSWVADDLSFTSIAGDIDLLTGGTGVVNLGGGSATNITSGDLALISPTGQVLDIQNGGALRIRNSTDTDWMVEYHDGTDLFCNHINTGEHRLQNANLRVETGGFIVQGSTAMAGDGLRMYYSNPSCYIQARRAAGSYGTANLILSCDNFSFTGVGSLDFNAGFGQGTFGGTTTTIPAGTGGHFIRADNGTTNVDIYRNSGTTTGDVRLKDGFGLRIFDSTDTDDAEFNHDGTDFNTIFTGTTDWNIDNADVRIAQDVFADNLPIIKFKDAATSRDSGGTGATLTDDPDLAGWALAADTWYMIEAWLPTTSGTGPDYKIRFDFTNAPQDGEFSVTSKRTTAAGSIYGQSDAAFNADISLIYAGTDLMGWRVRGAVKSNATTGGTLDFQWAQNTSSATATVLEAGAWISVTKLV